MKEQCSCFQLFQCGPALDHVLAYDQQLLAKIRSSAGLVATYSNFLQIMHHCASMHMHYTLLLPGWSCRLIEAVPEHARLQA